MLVLPWILPFIFNLASAFQTQVCCCGCTTKPCPEVDFKVPRGCPIPEAPCQGEGTVAVIDCNEIQSLWDQAIIQSAVESNEMDALRVHELLVSPLAESTLTRMERVLLEDARAMDKAEFDSRRLLMGVIRQRMRREKENMSRFRRAVVEGDAPVMKRRLRRQSRNKHDVVEQDTIGGGGASTKVNGVGRPLGAPSDLVSDASLVPEANLGTVGAPGTPMAAGGKKEGNCNDFKLRKTITDNIMTNPRESKRAIQHALEKEVGGVFSVVCSPCEFSFVVRSESYCDGFKNQIACFAYRDD